MPGLAQRNEELTCNGVYALGANGFWANHRDDVSYNQLQKFWSDLSPAARQKLLRIDKQTLFEQARKNMYCSRCNGLLLEGFLQIVVYGKSLQQEGGGVQLHCNRPAAAKNQGDCGLRNSSDGCQDEIQDPSVHPWGGLTTTRDGSLTLLDCYLYSKSLKALQNVFDSARGRERERELLYPDACGGGGRGWISQGIVSYGRGHGTRETCALHTARLSCDTLVDFWSALGEETRQSLLRMKEEDFIERLMYRFDSKRFCRDCRRNVIREFKELKELKRMRRETRCTSWFCVADTAFQYEVSDDTVLADWCQTFADTIGTYHHFEWAVGTGEGKSDILGFENVGLNGSVQVTGLDLGGLGACFITLRAWKMDGRCTEFCVKAHALKGQQCVHCRLVVGDGFVTITRGESIRQFFEHAEEAEEEEDDDTVDKDGNELDGECSRPQKHAKSPELAREFLLDAATVIFKEQVEKAFREGTARQNAHSIFVCLALKLLEERVHVACKEIITLEKQMKLLEEEEKEKREEEERKERRRTKEREKKMRRKERLKGKDRDKEKQSSDSNDVSDLPDVLQDETSLNVDEERSSAVSCVESVGETAEISQCGTPEIQEERFSSEYVSSVTQSDPYSSPEGEVKDVNDGTSSFTFEELKFSHRKLRYRKDFQPQPSMRWSDRQRFAVAESGVAGGRSESRHYGDDFDSSRSSNCSNRHVRINGRLKFNCPNNKINDTHSCSCHQNNEYRVKVEPRVSALRASRESRSSSSLDMPKQFYRASKYGQMEYVREGCGRPKSKTVMVNSSSGRELLNGKKVWEPMDSQKRYPRSNSDSDVTLKSSNFKVDGSDSNASPKPNGDPSALQITKSSSAVDQEENDGKDSILVTDENCQGCGRIEGKEPCFSSDVVCEGVSSPTKNCLPSGTCERGLDSTSSSDNCSSCPSEGDSSPSSSNLGTLESSSISDSDDSNHQLGGESLQCAQNGSSAGHKIGSRNRTETGRNLEVPSDASSASLPTKTASGSGLPTANVGSEHPTMFSSMPNQNLPFTMFQPPSAMGYYHQNPVSWTASPANGYLPYSHGNHYVYAGPIGYGFHGNPRLCVPYSPVQHLGTPLYNSGAVPVYQPGPKLKSDGQMQISVVQEAAAEANSELKSNLRCSSEVPLTGGGCKNDSSTMLQAKDSNFSLFHFGGPVELSTGCIPDSFQSKGETNGALSSRLSGNPVEDDPPGNKETTMEEYNLFAASNGIRFSIF